MNDFERADRLRSSLQRAMRREQGYTDQPELTPVADAGQRLGLSSYQVRNLIAAGELEGGCLNTRWYVKTPSIDALLERMRGGEQ